MCGRAYTPRTRAAARARTGAGSRLAAWPARPFKFLSHSGLGGCQASSKYRLTRRSWPERVATEAQLATGASSATQAFRRSASRPRRSASERANSHCAEIHTRESKSRLEMTYVLGRPTMKMKPMLDGRDET